jgi:hypothetical protein
VRIEVNNFGFYIWDLVTLDVAACPIDGGLFCGGYGTMGNSTYVNAAGKVDQMNIVIRPAGNLADFSYLVYPLEPPYHFGQEKHFAWANGYYNDALPICASNYNFDGNPLINAAYDGEIFCIETDGIASTVWRFGHNRALWIAPNFNTQPLGNVTIDGRWFLFTSGWDSQLGNDSAGLPRSDVWIVKLD